jgi:flagellar biosynthesis/type III secretory pathway chaperone
MNDKEITNFSKQMDLMGQITALLKIEMQLLAERKIVEAELAKLKEQD